MKRPEGEAPVPHWQAEAQALAAALWRRMAGRETYVQVKAIAHLLNTAAARGAEVAAIEAGLAQAQALFPRLSAVFEENPLDVVLFTLAHAIHCAAVLGEETEDEETGG